MSYGQSRSSHPAYRRDRVDQHVKDNDRPALDGLMSPYHTVLEPTTPSGWPVSSIVADRLGMYNPVVLEALEAEPDSWDRALARLMG